MRKWFLAILAACILTTTCYAHGPCLLSRDQAPAIRGFKLGMTEEETKRQLLIVLWGKADEIGVHEETIHPAQLLDKEAARGVKELKLEFLDGHLSYIEVTYDNNVPWNSVGEFKARVAESFNLPQSGWEDLGEKSGTVPDFGAVKAAAVKLTCSGFNLGLITNNFQGPMLVMGEAGLRVEKDKRRAALKNQKQRTFNPD